MEYITGSRSSNPIILYRLDEKATFYQQIIPRETQWKERVYFPSYDTDTMGPRKDLIFV